VGALGTCWWSNNKEKEEKEKRKKKRRRGEKREKERRRKSLEFKSKPIHQLFYFAFSTHLPLFFELYCSTDCRSLLQNRRWGSLIL